MDSPELIERRLREGLDHQHLTSLYRRQCYAFGMPWEGGYAAGTIADGSWPIFPDIQDSWLKIGESRRLLNTAYQVAARMLSGTPRWEFPQVGSPLEREVRSQWFAQRYQERAQYDWRTAITTTVAAGDSLGYSCIEVGLTEEGDYQKVALRHVPPGQVMYDRHALSPKDARWGATMDLMAVEDAEAEYGVRRVEGKARSWKLSSSSDEVQVVPVIRYWSKTTRAVILGDIGEPVLFRKENTFGRLPLVFYVHFVAPGMRYPVGRIQFQLSTAQMISESEIQLRDKTREPNYVMIDASAWEDEDMQDLRDKMPNTVFLRSTQPLPQPLIKVERSDVTNADMALREMLERQFAVDSGLTDLDRGVLQASERTKAENEMAQAGAQQNQSASRLQLMVFLSELGDLVTHIARDWDRSPTWVDVFGSNLLLNDPSEPLMSLANWFAEPSQVRIAEESLTSGDDTSRRLRRIAEMDAMVPYVQLGLNPTKLVEERVKAAQLDDVDEWVGQMPAAEAPPAM